ncbi:DUF5625 family protein [Xenorhabdus budapestensis]|uniref:DUF5625 domain-containing protein n=1 Tax=Xenorhabdus budapestensis TaxID=290110 RepID=A0A2D0IP14_XENBU|nr:DUF5625 family protein [Xenorhabdus budapestensis]PHM23561.1 hypothetical protein Xbud_03547 [Xenorhabdus budapestensis]
MKVLPRHWGYLLIFLVCGWLILFFLGFTGLVRCTGFVSGLSGCHQRAETIRKPVDVTKAGQSVTFDFEIPQEGDYQFALLFATGDSHDEMERRFKLFGDIDKDGVITPVSLHLVRNDRFFFDEKINAGGYGWIRAFYYEERFVNTAAREIKTLSLPPGRYSAVITTLEDIPIFNGIESFVELTYFNPKI